MMQRRAQAGSLLVISLWLVMILGAIAVALARFLSYEVRMTKYELAREQARTLARSGIYLAMERLRRDATSGTDTYEAYDWLGDDWADFDDDPEDPTAWVIQDQSQGGTAQGSEIRIHITDEERKLDVNRATPKQLEQLLGSGEVAKAIEAYYDQDEAGDYETPTEPPPYAPKNDAIVVVEELSDIPISEMTDDILETLQRFTSTATPTGGTPLPTLNINTAESEVLRAISEEESGGPLTTAIDTLVTRRPGGDQGWDGSNYCTATDPSYIARDLANCALSGNEAPLVALLSKANFTVNSSTFRIQSEAIVEDLPIRYRVEAIVERRTPPRSSRIIAWRES